MSDIKRIEPGARMSQAVVHGGVVYLSGQVAEGDGVGAQTEGVLAQIDRLLAAAGSSKSRILTAQVWLSDVGRFDEMNAVWEAWIDKSNPPARATGEVKLAAPQFHVEIIVTAAQG